MNNKQKRERVGALETEINEIKEQYRSLDNPLMSDEDLDKIAAMEDEKTQLRSEITKETLKVVEPEQVRSAAQEPRIVVKPQTVTKQDREMALRGFLLRGLPEQKDEYKEAAARCGMDLNREHFNIEISENFGKSKEQIRSSDGQSLLTNAAGKYLAPLTSGYMFEEALSYYWNFRDCCEIITTPDNYADHEVLKTNNTARSSYYVPELGDKTGNDMVFAKDTIGVKKIYSAIMPVSLESLQSTRVALEPQIYKVLGQDISRGIALETTAGDGQTVDNVTHLTGWASGVSSGRTAGGSSSSGSTASFNYDDLRKLRFSVDISYRNSPKCAWQMTDSTLEYLYSLVDDNGRPLMNDAFSGMGTNSFEQMLFGKPIYINNNLDNLGASKKTIFFGDWSAVKIRLVNGVTVRRSDEKYWTQDAAAYQATAWVGVKYVNAGTNPIKCLTQSAT